MVFLFYKVYCILRELRSKTKKRNIHFFHFLVYLLQLFIQSNHLLSTIYLYLVVFVFSNIFFKILLRTKVFTEKMPKGDSKIEQLIHCLSISQQEHLGKWLSIEVSKREAGVLNLYNYLIDPKPEEKIGELLFPNLKHEARMRKLSRLKHKLTQHIEEYMAIQAFRADESMKPLYLVKYFNQENNLQDADMFHKVYHRVERKLSGGNIKDTSYWKMKQHLIHELQHHYILHDPKKRKKLLNESILYCEIFTTLEKLHLRLQKLKIVIPGTTSFYDTPDLYLSHLSFLSKAPELREKEQEALEAIIEIYRDLCTLLSREKSPTPEEFQRFRDLLKDEHNYQLFERNRLMDLCQLCHNMMAGYANATSNLDAYKVATDFYEWRMERKLLIMDKRHYKNLISLYLLLSYHEDEAIRKESLAKAEKILNGYKHILPASEREEVYQLNLLNYYFINGEYQKVLEQKHPYKFLDSYHETTYRFIQLQTQYEIDPRANMELLEVSIHSLRQYIRSKKAFSQDYKNTYLERLRIFRQLVLSNSRQQFEELKNEIENLQPLSGKLWLGKKINERLSEFDDK